MNDADEVAFKLNEVIEILNEKGYNIEKLCTHGNTDFDDYGDWICTECGVTLEYSDD